MFLHGRQIFPTPAPDTFAASAMPVCASRHQGEKASRRSPARGSIMFSKARLDALSDEIFGVATTPLVLDVRLRRIFSLTMQASPCARG